MRFLLSWFLSWCFSAPKAFQIWQTFGKTLRQIRDATDGIKRDIRNSTSEIEKEFKGIQDDVKKSSKSVTDSFDQQAKNLKNISKKFKSTLESTDKETISNKRRPITEKFAPEEEIFSSDDTKEGKTEAEISEVGDSNDKEVPKEEPNSGYASQVANNKKKSDAKKADVTFADPEKTNVDPADAPKINKAPEAWWTWFYYLVGLRFCLLPANCW